MVQHLIDRPLRLAVCPRCHQPILAGMDCGVRVAVDPVRFAKRDIVPYLAAGRAVYVMDDTRGKPRATRVVPMQLGRPSALYASYVADHGCGTAHLSAELFEEEPQDPPSAPAPSPTPAGGLPGATEAARSVTLHRSDAAARCHHCGGLIPRGGDRIQMLIPLWQENEHAIPNRGTRKGSTRTIEGWGWERWVIHPDGCPASTTGTR